MWPLRLPRWTAVLVLPCLVGALVLMHGLDATTSAHGPSVMASAHVHEPDGSAQQDHEHCGSCAIEHAMAACVAVAVSVVALRFARGGLRLASRAPSAASTRAIRWMREVLRPSDPAWVRLAVMRC